MVGFYDNCPMNLLAGKGYKEIIAIRTLAMGIVQPLKDTDIHVTNIIPNESLGPVLNFQQCFHSQKSAARIPGR